MQQNQQQQLREGSKKGTKFASVRRGGESTYIQVRQIGSKGVLTNRAGIIVLLVVSFLLRLDLIYDIVMVGLLSRCWPLYALIYLLFTMRVVRCCFFL